MWWLPRFARYIGRSRNVRVPQACVLGGVERCGVPGSGEVPERERGSVLSISPTALPCVPCRGKEPIEMLIREECVNLCGARGARALPALPTLVSPARVPALGPRRACRGPRHDPRTLCPLKPPKGLLGDGLLQTCCCLRQSWALQACGRVPCAVFW